ncbi:hypothetical protein [Halodesulfovibrio spirochaetisodalis]|uniref:Uncharacterized protein n=1 Tax=Halodesulfovibrio spirochaetisodalis TaxID=1560234 RepID=A0A1B7XCB8_9BACT|nr:hypothetical protein [Halodesulfovibrio spirochaetisodalis]OBQ51565.1 hypothetical protein SP90_09280 [Halodesulfovibrio spirochaetisodalis]
MGKVLQVRVWASTYSEDEVRQEWPRLYELAFPKEQQLYVAKTGVIEMIETLVDACRFADWSDELKDYAKKPLDVLFVLCKELEAALSEWNPQKANQLTDKIEDALSDLEKDLPNE